jgi:hypothetical protein
VTRRLELGPLLVALGAVLLLVSLFLDWFEGGITAWNAFEVWDLVLAVLAVAALLAAVGALAPDTAVLDRQALPFIVGAVVLIVASQIIDPPPSVGGHSRAVGCWLALGAAALQLLGTVLTLSRVSLAINVEGRDTRRRVAAVDAREPTTTEAGSLFSRPAEPPVDSPAATDWPAADAPPEAAEPAPAPDTSREGPGTRAEGPRPARRSSTSASRRKT